MNDTHNFYILKNLNKIWKRYALTYYKYMQEHKSQLKATSWATVWPRAFFLSNDQELLNQKWSKKENVLSDTFVGKKKKLYDELGCDVLG